MPTNTHGGNLYEIMDRYGLSELIDFSASINPLGPPVNWKKIITANLDSIVNYPEIISDRLRGKIAASWKISRNNIVVGNGTTEIIYLICRAFLPERVLILAPTFSEYERAARCINAEIKHCLAFEKNNFEVDINELVKQLSLNNVDCLFICNPNNPTGTYIPHDMILYLIKQARKRDVLVILDEAFIDFCDTVYSIIPYMQGMRNLIVLQSLTKIYSIPGLRLGYAVGHKGSIKHLLEKKEPWSVNIYAQIMGMFLLQHTVFKEKTKTYIKNEKRYLVNQLQRLTEFKVFDSETNFLLIKILTKGFSAVNLKERMIKKGYLIRDCSDFYGLDQKYFRIAIKRHNNNIGLIRALSQVLH